MRNALDEIAVLAISAVSLGCRNVDGYREEFLRNFTDDEIDKLDKFEESLEMTYEDNLRIAVTVLKSKLKELES